MLNELAKQNNLWYSYALKICKCEHLANDLVQEMYIKLSNQDKEVNKSFVYLTLKSIFINQKKKEKHIFTDNLCDSIFKDNNESNINERNEALDLIKDLNFVEREVLLLTHNSSLRALAKEIDVPWHVLRYKKKQALDKLKNKYGKEKK